MDTYIRKRESRRSVIESPSKFRLFFAVICANVSSFALGTCIVWPSPMIPKLTEQLEDSPLNYKISRAQMGWIFCLIAAGAIAGGFTAGELVDRYGRKPTMVAASCIYIVGYTILIFGTHILVILTGRIVQGIACGFTMTVIPIYIGEISTKENRGSAGSFMMLFMTLGMLYVLCVGPYTHYVVFQELCLAIPLISFGGLLYLPESPHYLVRIGEIPLAIKALSRVRGLSLEIVKNEIPAIQEMERMKALNKSRMSDVIYDQANRRAALIAIGLMACQQFSGAAVVVINSQQIFMQAESNVDPAVSSIIIGVVQVISSVILNLLVDFWKRKTLLRISTITTGLAQFTIGTYFFLSTNGGASEIRWVPLVALITFQVGYRLGLGPLPFAILGELCAPNIKAIVAPCVTLACWGFGFLIGLFYPILDDYGTHYIFWGFSAFCGLAVLFVQFIVIETHGLTLSEIQKRLSE